MTDEQLVALTTPDHELKYFSTEEQAVLHFTDILTTSPEKIDQHVIDILAIHFTQEQIIDVAIAISAINVLNRLTKVADHLV